MTFIRSEYRKNFLSGAFLGAALLPILLATAWLVVLHNRIVNLTDEKERMNRAFEEAEVASAELGSHIFGLLGSEHLRQFAESRGLREEKNPEYFKVGEPWDEFASR